jgi:hypothetical protein
MKTKLILLIFVFCSIIAKSHDLHYSKIISRDWNKNNGEKIVNGSFYILKNNKVYIEKNDHSIVSIPFKALAREDQIFVEKKIKKINRLNNPGVLPTKKNYNQIIIVFLLIVSLIVAINLIAIKNIKAIKTSYLIPLLSIFILTVLFGFRSKVVKLMSSISDPNEMNLAFAPFVPDVNTFWDSNYFYVESKGIPNHQMMVGISNHGWQRQVPIPQCYIGSNAWPIPLNPVVASSPVPVNPAHFSRGAIAVAVNGVAIFNPYTNTGVDAFLDGQLDNFGGHCGRADDYHYHTAPLHLYNQTSPTLPIAYALDGFGVYGNLEPDGTNMLPLDNNHGHFGTNGVYHYHGSAAAPYMIANMVGQITEDATHQIIPQAAAHPVRPGQSPLQGALITACNPNANNNGYTLIYTLNGQTDSIVYNWNNSGTYNFHFYTPSSSTDSTYNGFSQCNVPTLLIDSEIKSSFSIFPNPAKETISLNLGPNIKNSEVKEISIYSINGNMLHQVNYFEPYLNVSSYKPGIYFVKINLGKNTIAKKFIVQ